MIGARCAPLVFCSMCQPRTLVASRVPCEAAPHAYHKCASKLHKFGQRPRESWPTPTIWSLPCPRPPKVVVVTPQVWSKPRQLLSKRFQVRSTPPPQLFRHHTRLGRNHANIGCTNLAKSGRTPGAGRSERDRNEHNVGTAISTCTRYTRLISGDLLDLDL